MYTNNQFHTSQVTIATESKRVVNKASLAIFSTGIGLCVACLIPSHWTSKLTLIGASCGLFYVSHRLDRLKASLAPYEVSAHIQSQQGYAQWLSTSFAPPKREIAIAAPVDAPAPVKFADVKQALSKPHVMLLGSTGDGKSTLAKHLAANCTAYTIVIDPHAAPDDWGNLPVFGASRNYGEIALIMGLILQLMQHRYDARSKGAKQFEPIVIICDEYPAIIASLEAGKVASSWMKLISREARKVAIRLVVLTQSPEVKAIGLEGEGSVRDNFCFVRLGEFALDHAKSLKDDAIKSAIEQADRPAMLGNLPCAIPTLSDRVAMPVLSMPSDYQELLSSSGNQALDSSIQGSTNELATQPQSTALAPVFQKLINYLNGKGWKKDYEIKAGVREFKDSDTPISELQGYLQFLEVQGYLETRSTGKGNIEAKTLDKPLSP
jgi:energy-coupling factor transporter ATP-binding protein EcfA2